MSESYERLKAQKDAIVAKQGQRERDLETALRAFLFLFDRSEDGEPEDQIEGLPDAHAFEMIDQAAHRDVPIPSRTPCVTVGQIRRARAALASGPKQAQPEVPE